VIRLAVIRLAVIRLAVIRLAVIRLPATSAAGKAPPTNRHEIASGGSHPPPDPVDTA
jgi:hypothetical protein